MEYPDSQMAGFKTEAAHAPARRGLLGAALAVGTLAASRRAAAQPKAPMKLLVGFPAGGLPDQVARTLADALRESLGTPVIVENRVGANGRIAIQAVKAAAPDGTTLLLTPGLGMTHLPHVYTDLGFDPFTDFMPVSGTVESDFAFAIDPGVPARTLREFAEWARNTPARAAYGSAGEGSAPHLMGYQLAKGLGVPMQHIPYKGANFALTDLMGGHLASLFATTPFLLTPHQNGKARVIGVTGTARSPKLPEVPTFRELGLPELSVIDGTWVLAPARTPTAIIDRLAAACSDAVASPGMKALIAQQHLVAAPIGPAALAKAMREQYDRQGAAVRAAGFKPVG
jgi:tripartite-type tricarboxylate transporter receptor subunit TctC